MLKLLLVPVLIYVAIVAAFYLSQRSLIFPARLVAGAGPLPASAQRLQLQTDDGDRLYGLHLRPRVESRKPVLLVFSGNAWNAEDAALLLGGLFPDANVIAFHYRGYRPSTGRPSAASLQADALVIHDAVAKRFPGRPIVAMGFSIGSGVAAHLAARRAIAGAILVTPFDSLAEVGHRHYPWLPVRLLLRHRMDPAQEISESRVPVALLAAGRDTLIPPRHAAALAEVVPQLVFNQVIEGAGHNDIYQHPGFRPAMAEALAALAEARH